MSSRRALALLCRGAACLWAVAILAVFGRDPGAAEAPAERRARIEVRPSPLPEPPRPAPRAAASRLEPRPAASRLEPADAAGGADLLDARGSFPALDMGYARFASFRAYARTMRGLGARFVVVRRRQVVAGVDLERAALTEVALEAAFSPRARDYTGEPALAALTAEARRRFGPGAEVVMLVPRALDASLFGGIAGALARRGDRHDAYREIRGRYEPAPGGRLRLQLESGLRADGSRVPLDLAFEFGA